MEGDKDGLLHLQGTRRLGHLGSTSPSQALQFPLVLRASASVLAHEGTMCTEADMGSTIEQPVSPSSAPPLISRPKSIPEPEIPPGTHEPLQEIESANVSQKSIPPLGRVAQS